MSVWSFMLSAALTVGSEVFHAGLYFLVFALGLELVKRALCDIIQKIYDGKLDVLSAHIAIGQPGDESASEAPPLHIV